MEKVSTSGLDQKKSLEKKLLLSKYVFACGIFINILALFFLNYVPRPSDYLIPGMIFVVLGVLIFVCAGLEYLQIMAEMNKLPQSLNMQQRPKQEAHYGKDVWVNPTTESLRKTECLCLNCANMKPGEFDHCHIAKSLYSICKMENVALAVTRCPLWKPKY